MTVELWIGQEFETAHERRAFRQFWEQMKERFDQNDEPYLILVNYFMKSAQIDLTVLKRNAIIVIELKQETDPFTATQNGRWLTISKRSVGNKQRNPYEQVQSYQTKWLHFLKENWRNFAEQSKVPPMTLEHIKTMVAISPRIHPHTNREALPDSADFQLVGLDELSEAINRQTHLHWAFSKRELNTLVQNVLNLRRRYDIADAYKKPYSHFKESGYPPNFRQNDISTIKRIIKGKNNLLVLGISGSGKSNVMRYLVSNQAVQTPGRLYIYIDCNSLNREASKEVVEEAICCQIIKDFHAQDIGLMEFQPDQKLGREALSLFMQKIGPQPEHLVVVFDRSELLQQILGESFFDYLRALRDINPRLTYIFSGRKLELESFGELTDILWNEPYWIGALSFNQAMMALERHLGRLEITTLKAEEKDKLLQCVGYHPTLLKYVCELYLANKINLSDPNAKIIEQLLTAPLIQRQCREIWQELDFNAQAALRCLAQGETVTPSLVITDLSLCGILKNSNQGNLRFASPVFEKYVEQQGPPPSTPN